MRHPDIVQKISSRENGILSDEEMDDNVMEVENSEEENEVDTTIEDFEVAMDDFKREVLKRIREDAHSYTKCVKSFTKQLRSITHSHHSIFQKTLFSFVNDDITLARKGRGKKCEDNFNPKASKSRRLYKCRGSQGARKGRPTKDVVRPKNKETTYHCWPKQKKTQRKTHPHSLSSSVDANRAAERKH